MVEQLIPKERLPVLGTPIRHQAHVEASIPSAWLHPEAALGQGQGQVQGSQELALEGFAQDDVEEWIDAAVGVAQTDGHIVGAEKGKAGLLYAQVGQLQDIVGRPAQEEGQADGHSHAGHFAGADTQAALGQRRHGGRHAPKDLEEHHADDNQWQGEGQDELVQRVPVGVSGRVGQKQGAAHRAVPEGHEARVHPDGSDGQQGQDPHQHHHRHCHPRRADVVEANGMHRCQVAVQRHDREDVSADGLAVGVQRRDDRAHGGTETPGAVAQQLMNEERHAQEEEQVHH